MGIGNVGPTNIVAIYSKKALLSLIIDLGLSAQDAQEYYEWHFSGLRAGANTPVIIDDTNGAE